MTFTLTVVVNKAQVYLCVYILCNLIKINKFSLQVICGFSGYCTLTAGGIIVYHTDTICRFVAL